MIIRWNERHGSYFRTRLECHCRTALLCTSSTHCLAWYRTAQHGTARHSTALFRTPLERQPPIDLGVKRVKQVEYRSLKSRHQF